MPCPCFIQPRVIATFQNTPPGSHFPCTGIGAAASGSTWRGPCPIHGQSPHLQEHVAPGADKHSWLELVHVAEPAG